MVATAAVLFDVDGTLVDSNYLHVHSWVRAFDDVGIAVETWRIHRSIGMDGDHLVASLSGEADDDTQHRVKDLHLRYFKETAPLLRPLPGARELLERIRSLGLRVVLASSASEEELAMARKVLDCDDLVDAATSSKDVDVAKPEPWIINVAMERVDVDAPHAVYVGDSVWDVIACERAGVPAIGLLSGGVSRGELETAGAAAVFDNPRDLCAHIDDTAIAALSKR
ncbi:HAD family hydrolase [Mycolicibacterium sp. 120270]|uniref:HAD family hydrolase n=1 Tax=Mycolicibacterium sp. 120270 TaxID=3090600 RepID=UPI00299E43E5|nr:HAD family hydrolase [Mycolicibacterium sp. 120270]MDX1883739.1 HAD family hydrolase [Mycolicibacterium sp. 120270]